MNGSDAGTGQLDFPPLHPNFFQQVAALGRIFLGLAWVASGLQQLVRLNFVRLVPPLPAWLPGRSVWVVASGVLLIAGGVALVLNRGRRPAALVIGLLTLVVLALYLPSMVASPQLGYVWTNPAKTVALLAGCALVARLPGGQSTEAGLAEARSGLDRGSAIAFGGFLVLCGVQHFAYADFVVQLIPTWIPARESWAYFTGVALITGGVGILRPRFAGLAATASAVMIFLWIPLLHLPRAFAHPPDPGETSAVFEALALSGVALLVAGTARRPLRDA